VQRRVRDRPSHFGPSRNRIVRVLLLRQSYSGSFDMADGDRQLLRRSTRANLGVPPVWFTPSRPRPEAPMTSTPMAAANLPPPPPPDWTRTTIHGTESIAALVQSNLLQMDDFSSIHSSSTRSARTRALQKAKLQAEIAEMEEMD
jgi:hypothetical protein